MSSMEIDDPRNINGDTRVGLKLRPVEPFESGEGLPYAPENWPRPGDNWRWKVGNRVAHSGHFLDRYLYPPKHLRSCENEAPRRGGGMASRLSVERYIRAAFPKADVRKFFASFIWKIPSKNMPQSDGNSQELTLPPIPVDDSDEDSRHDNESDGLVCKAGNRNCGSLLPPEETLPTILCDICCSERNFCPDCSCILCCKPISLEHGGYSYIKCEAVVHEGYICGHVAHVNCALRSYMAGTVGGSIGLDAQYYCRRCDAKTDLVPHVSRFLEICQMVESQVDVEKILNLGICMLRGSQKASAKELLNCIESTVIKLKCGTNLDDTWNEADSAIWSDFSENGDTRDDGIIQSLQDVAPIGPMPFNRQAEMHKLEDEIYQVLQGLRKAQESEYQIAEEKLHAQKEYLSDLHEQLEKEKSELSRRTSGTDTNDLMNAVLKRLDQIRKEVTKLKEMEEVAKGFGRTPRGILEEYFHLQVED